jgi:hypothetical protein
MFIRFDGLVLFCIMKVDWNGIGLESGGVISGIIGGVGLNAGWLNKQKMRIDNRITSVKYWIQHLFYFS